MALSVAFQRHQNGRSLIACGSPLGRRWERTIGVWPAVARRGAQQQFDDLRGMVPGCAANYFRSVSGRSSSAVFLSNCGCKKSDTSVTADPLLRSADPLFRRQ